MRLLATVQKPLKGWGKGAFASLGAAIEVGPGEFSFSQGVSLLTINKQGHIAPGETFDNITDGSTRVNAMPMNGVVDSAGECFVILNSDRLVQFGIGDDTVDANHDTAHGAHSSIVHSDILTYKDASDEYVLYSFNDATDGDVGMRLKSSGAYDDDYLSTVPAQVNGSALTKGVPHIMCIGPDTLVYITNGQYIAQFDQVNASVNYQKLNLGPGFIATSMTIDGNFLVISGYFGTTYITSYSKSVSRTWYWNTISPNFNKPIDLGDNYVSAVYNKNGKIFNFTTGRSNTTKIQRLIGGGPSEVVYENAVANIGQPPRHGSIDEFQGLIHYLPASGGALCVIGDNGEFMTRATLSSTDLGMCKNLSTNGLYIGQQIASNPVTYKISKINLSTLATSGNFRSGLILLPYKSTVEMIKIYLSQFGTGASIVFSLFQGYDSLSIGGATDLINRTIARATEGAIREYAINKTLPNMSSCYFNINFNHASASTTAAIIERVELWGSTPDKR